MNNSIGKLQTTLRDSTVNLENPRVTAHLWGAMVAFIVVTLAFVIPRQVPVIVFDSISNVELHNGFVEFDVDAYKFRECDPFFAGARDVVRGGETVIQYVAEIRGLDGRWIETKMEFLEDNSPGSSKIAGLDLISFGRWRVYFPRTMVAPPLQTRLNVLHLCGSNRDIPVKTTMGTYTIINKEPTPVT